MCYKHVSPSTLYRRCTLALVHYRALCPSPPSIYVSTLARLDDSTLESRLSDTSRYIYEVRGACAYTGANGTGTRMHETQTSDGDAIKYLCVSDSRNATLWCR